MSMYQSILEDGERSVRMLDLMLLDLRVAMLRRECHRCHMARAGDAGEDARHRALVRHLEGEVRRRLHDLSAVAERTAKMLVEEFHLDGGPAPGAGEDRSREDSA